MILNSTMIEKLFFEGTYGLRKSKSLRGFSDISIFDGLVLVLNRWCMPKSPNHMLDLVSRECSTLLCSLRTRLSSSTCCRSSSSHEIFFYAENGISGLYQFTTPQAYNSQSKHFQPCFIQFLAILDPKQDHQ